MRSKTFRARAHLLLIVAVLASFGFSLWSVGVTRAATNITVTSFADAVNSSDHACTLREAIIAANKDLASSSTSGECPAGSGTDIILLPPGTYTLTRTDSGNEDSASTGDLDIKNSVVISPTGPVTITAISGFKDRIFQILSGSATITGVTISGGNSGYGGGIYNNSTLTLANSTVTGNKAGVWGGGIKNVGTLTLTNVTISGNTSKQDGGGLFNYSNTATLNNVTITTNTADSDANGSGNGGGLRRYSGTVNIKNSIVAGNFDNSSSTKHRDCSGTLTSQGYNLIQNTTGCTITGTTTGNITGQPAGLDPTLQNNGGPTATHALPSGSPAIDAGNPAAPGSGGNACAATDQRGVARPQGAACDMGAYEKAIVTPPVIIRAVPGSNTTILGRQDPNTTFTLTVYTNAACGAPDSFTFLGSATVTTDENGIFETSGLPASSSGFVIATATDAMGNISNFSACAALGANNDSWVTALLLGPETNPVSATYDQSQYIDRQGQSRWFKFRVQPGSKVIITLTGLPANYDLTVYKDIRETLQSLLTPQDQQDLAQLGAEFAPDAFSPDAFSPDAFSPDAFSPDAFSPDAFSPDAFSPDAFSPDAFSPDAFSPDAFSPDAFSPDAFSPDAFSPDAFSPDAFSPDAFSPDAFSPDAFSGAQTRSLIAVSAFEGTAGEGILVNTWDNEDFFYVRVRGRNGAFSLGGQFHLQVNLLLGSCNTITTNLPAHDFSVQPGAYKTILLTDPARMDSTSALADKLAELANLTLHPEVAGVIVDVGADAQVAFANGQADDHPDCPFAKNLVAQSIKDIVDAYSGLEYVVIVGGDDVIPFFRYPDNALLASEKNYVPPVRNNTASQASLKFGYVLSQDAYGSSLALSLKNNLFPIPDLAVGRLVETETEVMAMLNAYLSTAGGVVSTPTATLVTGYDFLEDAANAVQAEFVAGTGAGATNDKLITPGNFSPQDPASWTADNLRGKLLTNRYDLVFLAGHFSGNSALAADYTTRVLASEISASSVSMANAIIFSAGCHSGYNIVDGDDIPNVTSQPDWAQAFNGKGATLVAGTGYQYGDTDFIEYSERLYLEFSKQLRAGTGPVAVGKALVQAKQNYLANTPQMRGIHEKALLESTLFGLPMLSVNLPTGRGGATGDTSIVDGTAGYSADPGLTLGLRSADVIVTPTLTLHTVPLSNTANLSDTVPVTATYLSGMGASLRVVANPAEPVLPLEVSNVSVSGFTLRGVGFRKGLFSDAAGITPLIGAATTEIRGVHTPFLSDVFFPIRPWSVNYFDALNGGATRLNVLAAQVQSSAPGASTVTLRQYNSMSFRLFYSSNTASFANGSTPALAAAPSIVSVSATASGADINLAVKVVGNPAAGIQEAWITFTGLTGSLAGQWQSLDLAQNPGDSTLWQGTLTSAQRGSTPIGDVRFMAQAVNGVGLVGLDTNQGTYYQVGGGPALTDPTTLTLQTPGASGPYGSQAVFTAILTSGGDPVPNQLILFGLGAQSRQAFTGANGEAAVVTIPLLGLPDTYQAQASFLGLAPYQASSDSETFTIDKQGTALSLDPNPVSVPRNADSGMVVTLKDAAGRPLGEKTVFFIVTDGDNSYALAVITDYAGRAPLGKVPLPIGDYDVNVYFSGSIPSPVGITLDDERYLPFDLTGESAGLLHIVDIPPVAVDDTYEVDEDSQLNVSAPGVLGNGDHDDDGDTLTAALAEGGGPAHGSVILNADGSFTYTPAENYYGPDSFTYDADDGFGGTGTATVWITVHPLSDDPTAAADETPVDEDSLDNPIDVLANDSDADNLSEPFNAGLSVTEVSDPEHGTASIGEGGGVTYTPDPDYFGDDSFTYTISDGSSSASATVTVHVANVNDDPTANPDSASVVAGTTDNPIDVLDNDSIAPDVGETLTITAFDATSTQGGTVNCTATLCTYTPPTGFTGTDSFTYTIDDGHGGTTIGTVTVEVTAANNLIYGVQNESANVQFFTVDKDTHVVSALGPVQNGYDIEGLELSPAGALYATSDSGSTFGQSGWLYSVNTETGLLSPIGFTGYPTGVPGLSFRPTDGVLWGWAKNKGLITVNLSTGQGTLAFAASSLKSIEGIAWNNDGTLMYLVASRDLYVYNPGAGTITKIASNLPGKTEAVDARSDHDGWLALGVHGNTIYTYDVGTKSIVTGESITTPYDDVEGLAWPY